MMDGFEVGDRVKIIKLNNNCPFPLGSQGTITTLSPTIGVEFDEYRKEAHSCSGRTKKGHGWRVNSTHLEKESMTEKRSNPKNFRNGDVVKVSDKKGNDAMVFVKFGENYYNLTAGGQMKACRYLPPGTKEIITNLSGMGKFFLMSEEELEEQAIETSLKEKVVMTGTGEFRWEPGHPGTSATFITDDMVKDLEQTVQTYTTEEK